MKTGAREQISPYQLIALLFFVRLAPRTLVCPTTMTVPRTQDLWLADAVSAMLTVGFVFTLSRLGQRHPGRSIIQYTEDLLGRPVGMLIGMLLAGYFFFVAAYTARMLGEAFNMSIMPFTPNLVFIGALTLLAANAARSGLEVVARTGEFLFPLILIVLLLLLVLPLGQVDSTRFLPLLRDGLVRVIPATSIEFMFYLEFMVLGLLIPHLRAPEKVTRFTVLFTAANGLMMTAMCLIMVGVFGPTLDALGLQAFLLARMIRVGEFFERVEALLLASWVLSTGVKIALMIWAFCTCLRQTFSLHRWRHLPYAAAALLIACSQLFFADVVSMARLLAEPWTVTSVTFILSLTALLWIAQLVRGGGDTD